jgi:hypothetical protein
MRDSLAAHAPVQAWVWLAIEARPQSERTRWPPAPTTRTYRVGWWNY